MRDGRGGEGRGWEGRGGEGRGGEGREGEGRGGRRGEGREGDREGREVEGERESDGSPSERTLPGTRDRIVYMCTFCAILTGLGVSARFFSSLYSVLQKLPTSFSTWSGSTALMGPSIHDLGAYTGNMYR